MSKLKLKRSQPTIGQLVRALRVEMGLTQEKMAHRLGVTFPTINRWENGRATPSPLALEKIEQYLLELGERGQGLIKEYGGSEFRI